MEYKPGTSALLLFHYRGKNLSYTLEKVAAAIIPYPHTGEQLILHLYNNDQIIYHHMHVTLSVGLAQTLFAQPDYLVILCLVYIIYLSPDTVKQTGSHIHNYGKFILGREAYTPLGSPCNHILAIIDYSNSAMPFVYSAFLAF